MSQKSWQSFFAHSSRMELKNINRLESNAEQKKYNSIGLNYDNNSILVKLNLYCCLIVCNWILWRLGYLRTIFFLLSSFCCDIYLILLWLFYFRILEFRIKNVSRSFFLSGFHIFLLLVFCLLLMYQLKIELVGKILFVDSAKGDGPHRRLCLHNPTSWATLELHMTKFNWSGWLYN